MQYLFIPFLYNPRPSITPKPSHFSLFILHTGIHNVSHVFETIHWQGLDKVTSWNNHTEWVHGTDASQFTYV